MAYTYIQIPHPRQVIDNLELLEDAIKKGTLVGNIFNRKTLNEVTRIVDNALGAGYFEEHLNEIECGWVCFHADAVVAWAAVSTDRHDQAPSIGCLKCVAVDPLFRGQGIARKLTELRLDYLTRDDAHCFLIFADAWVRPSGYCASCTTLEHFGFKIHEEIEGHFADSKHKCPVCKGECKCIARRYVKTNQR